MFLISRARALAAVPLISGLVLTSAIAQDVEEVVVTGQREAQRAAIEVKRDSLQVVDAVSADDIGKLPDHNTAAALRRIPGVSVMEDQSEPRVPVLRGLTSTYNRTTVDGAIIGAIESGARTVPLDIVPSVMVGRAEVVKTVLPEQDANAIGGIINIVTRSAFDSSEPFLNSLVSLGDAQNKGDVRNDKTNYRAALAGGTTFGADQQFGIVAGASMEQIDIDIPQFESATPSIREYTAAGLPVDSGSATGNGIQVPVQHRLFWYNNTKTREGANVKFDWRPSAAFRAELSALYADMEDDEERIEYRIEPIGNVASQTPTAGTFARGRGFIHLNHPVTRRTASLGRAAFEWEATNALTWSADALFSRGKLDAPNSSFDYRTTTGAGSSNFGFNYDTSAFVFSFNPTIPSAYATPTNYAFNSHTLSKTVSIEDVTQARTDLDMRTGWLDDALSFKVGAVARSTDRDNDQSQTVYTTGPGYTTTLADVVAPGPSERILGQFTIDQRVNEGAARALIASNASNFVSAVNDISSDYEVTEDVLAGYLQSTYERGPLNVIAGLRYERTDIDSESTRAYQGAFVPVNASGSYDNLLPGVHVRYELREDLVLRGAWTNTIGRPDFSSITARETLSFDGARAVLSRGNPDLKPRESRGFDVSIEYYPTDGVIALGLFHKDIENEIFTLTSTDTFDLGIGRGVETVEVSEPRNAQAAKLRGVEFGWQQTLTFLPAPFDGLGFNVNATVLDSDFEFLTSVGPRQTGFFMQPDYTTNQALFYQRGPIEVRVSHNYLGGFLETINDTIPNADQYWMGRHTYDANVTWRYNDALTLFASGENLTATNRRENTGPDQRYLQEIGDYGRTWWIGLTFSP
ncbi:MAG TPA: TonB-dependent receptor [Steroidobacteraceae bacterium]|nr:TonB-dependent receptor [Steroidobacteraceae bacterium]